MADRQSRGRKTDNWVTVHADRDEHFHDQQAIREKAQSGLERIDATVHDVNIRKGKAVS